MAAVTQAAADTDAAVIRASLAEAFLAVFRGRATYDLDREDARPWLFGILTREMATHHRRAKARYRAMSRSTQEPAQDGPAEQAAARVVADAARGPLAAALAGLAPGDRNVLVLAAWGQPTGSSGSPPISGRSPRSPRFCTRTTCRPC